VAPVPEAHESRWPPDHDDLVLERGITAGDFRDGVEAVLMVAGEFGFDIHLQRDRHVRLEQTIYAP